MPALINFKDAVTAANLDPNALYAVCYVDGLYANEMAVRTRCPKAKVYGITVRGATGKGIFACDSETGDLTVPQTMVWNAEQAALGVEKICDYANQNRWENEGLLAEVQHFNATHPRTQVECWDADYDGSTAMPAWASAKQYADPGPVDLDVALASFFEGVTPLYDPNPPRPVVKPSGHAIVLITIDLEHKTATHRHVPGTAKWGSKDETLRLELDYGLGGKNGGVTQLRQL